MSKGILQMPVKNSIAFAVIALFFLIFAAFTLRVPTDMKIATLISVTETTEGCGAVYVYGNNQTCGLKIVCSDSVRTTTVLALDSNGYCVTTDWYGYQEAAWFTFYAGLLQLVLSIVCASMPEKKPVEEP